MCGRNSSFVHGPGVNIANTDLPVAGPSHHREQDPQASSGIDVVALWYPLLSVQSRLGLGVQLVTKTVKQVTKKEQWSVTSCSPQQ